MLCPSLSLNKFVFPLLYSCTQLIVSLTLPPIPPNPPIVNKKTNPIAQSIGVSNLNEPPKIVATQLNILIPIGTAIHPGISPAPTSHTQTLPLSLTLLVPFKFACNNLLRAHVTALFHLSGMQSHGQICGVPPTLFLLIVYAIM